MTSVTHFRWVRVIVAILAAEALPILALVAIVVIYSLVRSADSPTPEAFAPRAGNWVGPIGGFLAVLLFAYWAAKPALYRELPHGVAVGAGTAALDLTLGALMAGDSSIYLLLVLSNGGRLLAGALGGCLASLRSRRKLTRAHNDVP